MRARALLAGVVLIPVSSEAIACDSQPIGWSSGWTCTWQEEFDDVQLDTDLWQYRLTQSSKYASCQQQGNVTPGGGSLQIHMRHEGAVCGTSKEYTGGGVISKQDFGPYGYFEARIQLSGPIGWHKAFWTYCSGGPTFADRSCSMPPGLREIGIVKHDDWLEDRVPDPDSYVSILSTTSGKTGLDDLIIVDADLTNEWHVYGARHEPGVVEFYLDGELVRTLSYEGHPGRHHVWLSAIRLIEQPSSNADGVMLVDWVRFYQ